MGSLDISFCPWIQQHHSGNQIHRAAQPIDPPPLRERSWAAHYVKAVYCLLLASVLLVFYSPAQVFVCVCVCVCVCLHFSGDPPAALNVLLLPTSGKNTDVVYLKVYKCTRISTRRDVTHTREKVKGVNKGRGREGRKRNMKRQKASEADGFRRDWRERKRSRTHKKSAIWTGNSSRRDTPNI